MRRTTAFAATLIAALSLGACSGSSGNVNARWTPVAPASLPADPGSRPFESVVSAGGSGRPALIGGVVLGAPSSADGFFPGGSRSVALWSAPTVTGPWTPASLNAVPGRDGPNETVMYLAEGGSSLAAFAWRNSPTEGYPRPSVWVASRPDGLSWDEILESREFFGGPDIVGFGGMGAGPHGYFVTGTWTQGGPPAVAVWHSADGSHWARDTGEQGFQGGSGTLRFGEGVADGARGVLLIGNVEVPTFQHPGADAGSIWFSRDGGRWAHVYADPSGDSTFDAVAATSAGWIVAGTAGARRPAVWFVRADLRVEGPVFLPAGPTGPSGRVSTLSASATRVVVAGSAGNKAVLWTARLAGGVPRSWEPVSPPAGAEAGLGRVVVSTGGSGTIVSLVGSVDSEVWTTPWH